jgi:hypothetical protein
VDRAVSLEAISAKQKCNDRACRKTVKWSCGNILTMLSEVEMGQVHTNLPSAPETPENLGCSLIARMQSAEGHRQARAGLE